MIVISEISSASNEQTAGIEQINIAIVQMDEVTQQNASLVEEAAAAAESMQDQARTLSEVVSVFKLDAAQSSKLSAVTSSANAVSLSDRRTVTKSVAKKASAKIGSSRKAIASAPKEEDWAEF